MSEKPPVVKKMSSLFLIVIFVMLALSIAALYQALEVYRNSGKFDLASITLSFSAIALSSYMFFQMRAKPMRLGFEMQKVFTTIQCSNCSFTSTRTFQRGDYILKEIEPCPQCNNKMIISSIYREVDEKEKEKETKLLS